MSQAIEQEIRTLRAHFWSARDPEGRAFAPLADAYRRKGDLEEAAALAEDGLARLPDFTPGYLVSARIQRARGALAEAREALDRVLDLDPENVLALLERAELQRDEGDRDGAVADLRRLLELDPGHMGARAALERLEAIPTSAEVEGVDFPPADAGSEESGVDAAAPATGAQDMDVHGFDMDPDEEPEIPTPQGYEEPSVPDEPAVPDEPTMLDQPTMLDEAERATEEPRAQEAEEDAVEAFFSPEPPHPDPEGVQLPELAAEDPDLPGGEEEVPGFIDFDLGAMEEGVSALGEAFEDEVDLGLEPTLESEFQDLADDAPGAGIPSAEDQGIDVEEPYVDFARGEPEPESALEEAHREEHLASFGEDAAEQDSGSPGDVPVHLRTRTMAEIYLKQGFREEALQVLEHLLEGDPHDESLKERVRELKAEVEPGPPVPTGEGWEDAPEPGHVEVEGDGFEVEEEGFEVEGEVFEGDGEEPELGRMAPQWAGDEAAEPAGATPFAWGADESERHGEALEGEPERSIRSHFDDLLAWVPGAVPISALSPDADPATAPPDSPLARSLAEGTTGSDAGAASRSPGATDAGDGPGGLDAGSDDDDDLDDFRSWLKSLES